MNKKSQIVHELVDTEFFTKSRVAEILGISVNDVHNILKEGPEHVKFGMMYKKYRTDRGIGFRDFCIAYKLNPLEVQRVEKGLILPTSKVKAAYLSMITTNA